MKKHILIVEDNEIAMMVETMMMKSLDCEVDGAENGEKAILLVQENKYDLILMDLGLPGMDGIKTTQEIKLFQQKINHDFTPIIAVTGNADETQHALCIEAGMSGVIVKPLLMDKAKSILDQLGKMSEKFEP
jgi:CheY-like chemotaxis protein